MKKKKRSIKDYLHQAGRAVCHCFREKRREMKTLSKNKLLKASNFKKSDLLLTKKQKKKLRLTIKIL